MRTTHLQLASPPRAKSCYAKLPSVCCIAVCGPAWIKVSSAWSPGVLNGVDGLFFEPMHCEIACNNSSKYNPSTLLVSRSYCRLGGRVFLQHKLQQHNVALFKALTRFLHAEICCAFVHVFYIPAQATPLLLWHCIYLNNMFMSLTYLYLCLYLFLCLMIHAYVFVYGCIWINISISKPVSTSIHLYINIYIYLSVYLSVCLKAISIYISFYTFTSLYLIYIYTCIYIFIHLNISICLNIDIYIYLLIYISLDIYPFFNMHTYPQIHISIYRKNQTV